MIRARTLLPAGTWDAASAADRVVLPHDGRHRRRIAMRGEGDVVFLLDLPEATRLKQGDGLALDDGRTVAVVAAEEPVAELVARDPHHLARLAWHLGNRHVPAELLADRIRIARDSVLEEMARGLGAEVEVVEAAFEPEGGAYEAAEAHGGQHGHHHDHAHDHHHAHGDACGCGHDHDHDHGHAHGHDHDDHGRGHDHHEHEHEHHEHEHHEHEHDEPAHHGHAPAARPRDVLHAHGHDHDYEHDHDHDHDHAHDHGHSHDAHGRHAGTRGERR